MPSLPTQQPLVAPTTEIVLAKGKTMNFDLFMIAGGQPKTIPFDGGLFGLKFVVKRSWKTDNNSSATEFEIQLISHGIEGYVSKQSHVVKTKIETVLKEKEVTKKEELKPFETQMVVEEKPAW